MKNIQEKLFIVGLLDVLSDIFYEVLEKEDTNYEVMEKYITDKEILEKIRHGSSFSGDIIREVFYNYSSKIQEELKKEIISKEK